MGSGNVGYHLAKLLVEEGHDIVVIDRRTRTLDKLVEILDIKGVQGNGAYYDVQMEANVPEADLFIAAAQHDEINMLACLLAEKIGAKKTIARVRDQEYSKQLYLLEDELGLSLAINPELAAAEEITRILKFPTALRIDTMAKGRVELIHFKLGEGNPLNGIRLQDIDTYKVLISAVERDSEVFIPTGNCVLDKDDKVHIIGKLDDIANFFKSLGLFMPKSKYVIMVGGGQITFYLAQRILELGMQVKIIERDKERCLGLCELLPAATIINADGADQDVLVQERIESADSFVALTDSDETNLIIAMFAKSKNVAKVITKINRSRYIDLLKNIGIDSIISQQLITSNTIARFVRAMQNPEGGGVKTLYKFAEDKAEALEFIADANSKNLYEPIKDLSLKKNMLIAALVRNGEVMIPDGNDKIMPGDSVIVVTTNNKILSLDNIFARPSRPAKRQEEQDKT